MSNAEAEKKNYRVFNGHTVVGCFEAPYAQEAIHAAINHLRDLGHAVTPLGLGWWAHRAGEKAPAAPEKNLEPAISRRDLFAAAALSSMKVKVFSSANAKTEAAQYDRECARSAWAMADAMLAADTPKEQAPAKPKHPEPSERRYSVEVRKKEVGQVRITVANDLDFFAAVRETAALTGLSDDFALVEVARATFDPSVWLPLHNGAVHLRIWRTK